MLVGGVDFSGAKSTPNDTWLVTGHLGSLGLEVASVKNPGSLALAAELDSLSEMRACGLDFPFSLPIDFMRYLARKLECDEFQEWQELALKLVFMTYEDFAAIANEFEATKRFTDKNAGRQAKSPIHQVNPNMVPMTFHGIRLLARLNPSRYSVIPFQSPSPSSCTLLEVYPREILWLLGVPDQGYKTKDKKTNEKTLAVRRQIVDGLLNIRERGGQKYQDCPRLNMTNAIKGQVIASDHALDALVACYAAGLYFANPELFPDPLDFDNECVLTEGWIYAPSKLKNREGTFSQPVEQTRGP
jgi:hypothetical protein